MSENVKMNGGTSLTEWNPMRAMREMLRWDPFREMAPMIPASMFERAEWNPNFDVTETKDAYVFARSFTLPAGADAEHAKTELKEGVLTLVVPKLAEAQAKRIPISTVAKS